MHYTLIGESVIGVISPVETQHILRSSWQRLNHTQDSILGIRERVESSLVRVRQSEARVSASDHTISSAENLGGSPHSTRVNAAAVEKA
jgi:hypothetical protein